MYYPHVRTYPLRNFFTAEECEFMLDSAETVGYTHQTFSAGEEYPVHYDFYCANIPLNQTGWDEYVQRILTHAYDINNQTWQLEVTNIEENQLYVMRFDEGHHHMRWHMDCTGWSIHTYSRRKISFAFNLNPVNSYTGGELELIPECRSCTDATRDVGSGMAYPSFRAHRITPVQSGTKYLLMGYVSGPTLK